MVLRTPLLPLLLPVLALLLQACGVAQAPETADETFGCEAGPTGDPIGGGEGCRDIRTGGDFTATSVDELFQALSRAQQGQVIFIPDGTPIDLTGRPTLRLPAGITLAGTRGPAGSAGAWVVGKLPMGTRSV